MPGAVDPAPLVEPKPPAELEPKALELPLPRLALPKAEGLPAMVPGTALPLPVVLAAPAPVVLARLDADPSPACSPGRS